MAQTRKRPLTAWNIFVKKVRTENPGKTFKEVLLLASSLKKKGQMGKPNMVKTNMGKTIKMGKGKKKK
jgi:hypothetical protein